MILPSTSLTRCVSNPKRFLNEHFEWSTGNDCLSTINFILILYYYLLSCASTFAKTKGYITANQTLLLFACVCQVYDNIQASRQENLLRSGNDAELVDSTGAGERQGRGRNQCQDCCE